MKMMRRIVGIVMGFLFACVYAQAQEADSLQARWRIQKTAPVLVADLDSSAIDLKRPDNIRQTVEYDDSANVYYLGSKIGDTYLNAPILMTPDRRHLPERPHPDDPRRVSPLE